MYPSQCNQSCSVCSISFDLEHPLVPYKSPVFWYLCSVYFFQTPLLIMLLSTIFIEIRQFSFSSSTGLCHVSWNFFGSVGPDVTAEIRQVLVSNLSLSILLFPLIHFWVTSFLLFDFWSFPILLSCSNHVNVYTKVLLFHGVIAITTDFVLFCFTFFQGLIILIIWGNPATKFFESSSLFLFCSQMSSAIVHLCSG